MITDVISVTGNDVIHCVRRCNVVLRLKDVINACKRMRRGLSNGGSSSVQRRKLEEAEHFKFVFVVYCALKYKKNSSSA